jgi:hypothetical protein
MSNSKETTTTKKIIDTGVNNLKETKEKKGFHIVAEVEKTNVIETKDIDLAGIKGTEKVYFRNFDIYELENSKEDEPIYKSEIELGDKVFDIFVKYNQGRKQDKPIHLIVTVEGNRRSLGFFKGVSDALKRTKIFVYNNITNLAPPANL